MVATLFPATLSAQASGPNIEESYVGLPELGAGFVYEGWLIIDGAPVSTGLFTVDAAGEVTQISSTTPPNAADAATFVLTIEPSPDPDPAPAATHVLAGDFVNCSAELNIEHPAAIGTDFSESTGTFIVATPTTNDTTDEYSGVWFLETSTGSPAASLDVPNPLSGWQYEGWVVGPNGPISTGTFTTPAGADVGSGFNGTDNPPPPFPGEDFINNAPAGSTFPTDLSGYPVVISVEPVPDDSPAPFPLRPLQGEVPTPANPGVANNNALSFVEDGLGGTVNVPCDTALQTDGDAPTAAPCVAVQFSFEQLQPPMGFFITEPWVGLHDGTFDLFESGQRASAGLEALAEGGNTADLGAEFAQAGRLQTTIGNGNVQFISPGETIEGSIVVRNAAAYRYFSYASMLIPSNDAFIGNDDPLAYELFDAAGNFTGPVTFDVLASDIYDAGTEVNDGQGAAGFSQGLNGDGGTSTDDPTSTVGIHPDRLANIENFQTAAGTVVRNLLTPDEAIARVTVDCGDPVETVAAVGPLFDGYVAAPAAPQTGPALAITGASTNVVFAVGLVLVALGAVTVRSQRRLGERV